MSEIDIQNAKQIRDPMDVLIEMELASDDVTLSYSGYSGSAKVADGELDESTWPMRKLADLQGDGFPLDGSCVLYDSGTIPSQANGKLGVRGNVGEAVTITITGNKSIASLFIFATGAESVTFGSTTTPIFNTVVTIPVGATSITITLNPASETTRIEISQIGAGAKFRITNENLIRATVSLRSDLSIIDPTLPESEINIEAYQDTDISEAVASIPEDTPITYSAGYEGDMSPVRKFYVTGQVTWADNVLSIQGVDAVHFLDEELPGELETPGGREYDIMYYLLVIRSKIDLVYRDLRVRKTGYATFVIEQSTIREIVNKIMWMFKDSEVASPPFVPCYVDAGRPSLYVKRMAPKWGIKEEECGDVKFLYDRAISKVIFSTMKHTVIDDVHVGTFSWAKGSGAFIELDDRVVDFEPAFKNNDWPDGAWSSTGAYGVLPGNSYGGVTTRSVALFRYPDSQANWSAGDWLFNSDSEQGVFKISGGTEDGATVYTQVIPWDKYYSGGWSANVYTQNQFWNEWVKRGNIRSTLDQMEGVLWGRKINSENYTGEVDLAGEGAIINLSITGITGLSDSNPEDVSGYPGQALKSHYGMSKKTGKFTWKGDPRMQPRDVVEWERLDGTTTTITLENITLTHEGGGTMAEITYREGVV